MKDVTITPAARGNAKREAIIHCAFPLFFKYGFHATGVDTLLADSGISKRTLYKYFRSKEELIAALVEHYQALLFEGIPKRLAVHSKDPKEQVLHLFDIKEEEFSNGNFNGCFAINAKLEFQGKDPNIETACKTLYEKLEAYVAELCKAAKCKHPKKIAEQVMILFQGAIIHAQMNGNPYASASAKKMARTLIDHDL